MRSGFGRLAIVLVWAAVLTLAEAPPEIDRIEVVGDEVRLWFGIEAGRLYAVEYTDDPAGTNWATLALAASKFWPTNCIATDSRLASPLRFYRLAILGEID